MQGFPDWVGLFSMIVEYHGHAHLIFVLFHLLEVFSVFYSKYGFNVRDSKGVQAINVRLYLNREYNLS